MKLVNVTQRVRMDSNPSWPKPSRQASSEPACVPVMGGMKPGVARVQAALLSPEMSIIVVQRDSPGESLGESRRRRHGGRQQSRMHYDECAGHHRGLRAGHAPTGVARKLGRASGLPAQSPATRAAGITSVLSRQVAPTCQRAKNEVRTQGIQARKRKAKRLEMGDWQS